MDNISELIERLSNDEDAVKKMAVFKLQSNIGDPSFAEAFIHQGGLNQLKRLAIMANGNTLAYSLTSFSRLLELDKGWEAVGPDLIERVVELIVTHPLVNILRGAMSILVSIVSHPYSNPESRGGGGSSRGGKDNSQCFGFRALRPAIAAHPRFLEMLVSRLSSADHALCANSLQLINSLMRDAITNEAESEWPKFIKRLQDLGVIKAVFVLMQSSALQDLAHPLLEFQALTKVLLKKWRDVNVDLDRKEHRIALKGLHLASAPDRSLTSAGTVETNGNGTTDPHKKKHNPEKWRRLGFETESPASEFTTVGFLGMMDLTDFVRKREDNFQKIILEQTVKEPEKRCPVARGSIAVTELLYHLFEVDRYELDEAKTYQILESRTNFERAFRPLLLQWSRLHTAGLTAFFRLWKETDATLEDFDKVVELLRVLVIQVVGLAPRTREVTEIEDELAMFDTQKLRELQMQKLEQAYEAAWAPHLKQVRDELKQEAVEFVKEQRIRCLLGGEWFPVHPGVVVTDAQSHIGSAGATSSSHHHESGSLLSKVRSAGHHSHHNTPIIQQPSMDRRIEERTIWRFVRLSTNRRFLFYGDFEHELASKPGLEMLPNKIDLSTVSSVVSNVTPAPTSPTSSSATLTPTPTRPTSTTRITIHGYPTTTPRPTSPPATADEIILLTLNPSTHSIASEWLDGLLMLLNQQPITAETQKLVGLITGYGLKIRLLNVRYDCFDTTPPEMPRREEVGGEFFYELYV